MTPPDRLSDTLKTWKTSTPGDPAAFRSAVWARIEGQTASGKILSMPWWLRLTRPAAAAAVLVASLVLGSGVALAYDRFTSNDRMAQRVAQSIDPLQMHASE